MKPLAKALRCTLLVLLWTQNVRAQAPPPDVPRGAGLIPLGQRSPLQASGAVLIEPSAPIMNLFTRAQDGIQRRDWKFAIDSLQRIIDDPGGSLIARGQGATPGGILYESTRRQAIELIGALPPEGLSVYRLLYDGKAGGLLHRANQERDPGLLREIVDRYPLSRWGDDAADLFASWLLDEGRPTAALAVLRELKELVPDSDVPARFVIAKMAAAQRLLGRFDEARILTDDYRTRSGDDVDVAGWLDGVEPFETGGAAAGTPFDRTFEWPLAGGSLLRNARMAEISPSLVDPIPWQFDISPDAVTTWERAAGDDPGQAVTLPWSELTASGDRVFVRQPGGCIALDAEDLALVWAHPPVAHASAPRRTDAVPPSALERRIVGAELDSITASITLAHGLLLSVERNGRGDLPTADAVNTPPAGAVLRRTRGRDQIATRLVAYDIDSGEMVWQRGRTFDSGDALGDVEFRAAPVAVRDELWVPYTDKTDVFLAALRPEDGALLRNLLLCSLRKLLDRKGSATPMAVADGIAFVPTGEGALVAVNVDTFQLRWAAQYGVGSPDPGHGNVQRQHRPATPSSGPLWLPAPPMVVPGMVIIPPTYHEELIALDSSSGRFRWAVAPVGCSYIVGADSRHVWLGGRAIARVSLADGSVDWRVAVPGVPTGRAVLSGNTVHIPTAAALLALDAESGDWAASQPLPGSQMPLGNLVAADFSLYSVDPVSVRKYPDIDRSYSTALARHGENPGDVDSALRLAWIELLRGSPEQARAVLQGVALTGSAARRADAVARVTVEALHRLAARTGTHDPAQAAEFLQEAAGVARSPADRLRTVLALADMMEQKGDQLEAFRLLLSLGVSDDANLVVPLAPQVQAAAHFQVASRMSRLESGFNDLERTAATDEARKRFDDAVRLVANPIRRVEGERALRRLVNLRSPRSVSANGSYTLGARAFASQAYEAAEQLFQQCMNLSTDDSLTALAQLSLCSVWEVLTPTGSPQLTQCLDSLDGRFGKLPFADVALADRSRSGSPVDAAPGGTIHDIVATMRQRVSRTARDAGDPADDSDDRSPAPEIAWEVHPRSPTGAPDTPFDRTGDLAEALERTNRANVPRLVTLTGHAALLDDRAVFVARGGVVYCQRLRDGALLWQTTLHPIEYFSLGIDVTAGTRLSRLHFAAADGQTAVFNGGEALYGVGLITGRRLWIRPLVSDESRTDRNADRLFAAHSGSLAAVSRPGILSLFRVSDGSLMWERALRGESVGRVELTPKRVVVVDPAERRVHLLDRADGSLIKQMRFEQLDPPHPIRVVRTGGVLCGPDSWSQSDFVAAMDLSSGADVWHLELNKPLASLSIPQDGFIGVGLLGGDVLIVEAASGEVVVRRNVSGVQSVWDTVMHQGTLYLQANATGSGNKRFDLVALDIATGDELWRREDLAVVRSAPTPLRLVDNAIPTLIRREATRPGEQGRRAVNDMVEFALIEACNGENRGATISLGRSQPRNKFNGDFGVWPGMAVGGFTSGVRAFRLEGGSLTGAGL